MAVVAPQVVVPPPPATSAVVVAVRRRTQLRPVSATIRAPVVSTARPDGLESESAVGATAVLQVVVAPPPANRVTLPAVSTLRMQAAPVSAMYTLPAASTATPRGAFSRSAATGPAKVQALAAPVPPAKVEIVPSVATTRMRLLPESAMKTRPSGASKDWRGTSREAAVAAPPSPAKVAVPLPA